MKCATVGRFCLFSLDLSVYDGIILRIYQFTRWRNELSDMSYWIVDGQKLTNEQYEELERQKRLEKQRIQEESERLSRQLSEAYAALKEHLERNPDAGQKI